MVYSIGVVSLLAFNMQLFNSELVYSSALTVKQKKSIYWTNARRSLPVCFRLVPIEYTAGETWLTNCFQMPPFTFHEKKWQFLLEQHALPRGTLLSRLITLGNYSSLETKVSDASADVCYVSSLSSSRSPLATFLKMAVGSERIRGEGASWTENGMVTSQPQWRFSNEKESVTAMETSDQAGKSDCFHNSRMIRSTD